MLFYFFFFNDTATTEIYTLSLHDALPIFGYTEEDYLSREPSVKVEDTMARKQNDDLLIEDELIIVLFTGHGILHLDRKSTRLNSSHQIISYAVFCLKKKKHDRPRADAARH